MALVLLAGQACPAAVHAALGSRVDLHLPINARYPGTDGAQTLTDGVSESLNYREHLGFEGPDVEVTVHLPVVTDVHTIAADFLHHSAPAIFRPVSVDIAISENGRNFRTIATLEPTTPEKEPGPLVERFEVDDLSYSIKAVRIRAANGGHVPPWHRAPDALRWIFISEILVNPGEEPRSAVDVLAGYRFGDSRWPLTSLENALREADEDSRHTLCTRLAELLADTHATQDAKRFCLHQLSLFGTEPNVASVSALLAHDSLALQACRTLAALGGDQATAALRRAAMSDRDDIAAQAIAALGTLKAAALLDLPEKTLQRQTPGQTAVAAIGQLGSPAAADWLTERLQQGDKADRLAATDALLDCAGRLLAARNTESANEAFRTVETRGAAALARLAGLAGRVRSGSPEALTGVLGAAASEDRPVRRAALALGADLIRRLGPAALDGTFASLPETARVITLRAVGERGQSSEADWVRARLNDPALPVRVAGLRALGRIGCATDVPALCAALAADNDALKQAAAESLTRLEGDAVDQALAGQAPMLPGGTRRLLCHVAANRASRTWLPVLLDWARTPDDPARDQAWKTLADLVNEADLDAVIAAFDSLPADDAQLARPALVAVTRHTPAEAAGALALADHLAASPSDHHRAVLVAALGTLEQPNGLAAILTALQANAEIVKAAAMRALTDWPSPEPITELLQQTANEDDQRLRILGIRTVLSLLRNHSTALQAGTVDVHLTQLEHMDLRTEERSRLVHAAGKLRSPKATEIVLDALSDADLTLVAETALLAAAPDMWIHAPLRIHDALRRITEGSDDPDHRKRAAEALGTLPDRSLAERVASQPWVSWFNGMDLSGWRIVNAESDSWTVREAALVANAGGGGWLARTEPVGDYVLRFEVKLPPGGNSGVFLRPPLEGNPAWQGIEVQILDDTAPRYRNLKPYQYCASVYGMAAASPGVSRPPGTWQSMTVLCVDRTVMVWLNGQHVAAADLDDHMDQAGKIPGLTRKEGFPGLQNEHGTIMFRNIEAKIATP